MRLSSKIDKLKTDWIPGLSSGGRPINSNESLSAVTHVRLFDGGKCIREDQYDQQCVSIGSSTEADLVLKSNEIAGIHAYVYVENEQLFIFGLPSGNKLTVNNKAARAALLDPKDSVGIGPYKLKFEMRPIADDVPFEQPTVRKKKNGHKGNGNGNGNGNGKGKLKLDLKSIFQDLLPQKNNAPRANAAARPEGKHIPDADPGQKTRAARGKNGSASQDDIPFQVVFKGQFKNGKKPLKVVRHLKKRFKLQEDQTAVLLSGKPITINPTT